MRTQLKNPAVNTKLKFLFLSETLTSYNYCKFEKMKKNPTLQGLKCVQVRGSLHPWTLTPQCSEREKTEVSRLLHFLKEITTVGDYDYSLNNKIFSGHLF